METAPDPVPGFEDDALYAGMGERIRHRETGEAGSHGTLTLQ